MRPVRIVLMVSVLAMAWLASSEDVQSQPKKETTKAKGQLPSGWKALDLTAAQKDEVYKIQSDYRTKIDKLEDEIKKLKGELSHKLADVLTPEQKKKLIDAIDGGRKESPKKEPSKKS